MELNLSVYQGKKICVAVSGGGDSVALLHYFYTHAAAYDISLSAVNCEHGIRGADSLADSAFVKKLCAEWSIPLYEFSCDCVALSEDRKVGLETAAREFRYECFGRLIGKGEIDLIATAHHQGDNAETVLFNLCRGAALTGAGGISDRKGYIRPLLHVTKKEILHYLRENNLKYRNDETNQDENITRNAIRLRILPALEEIIPGAAAGINRFSALAKDDDAFLYELAMPLLNPFDGGVKIAFSDKKPLFYRACLSALKQMGAEKDYTLANLNALYALQFLSNGERASMPKNIVGIREYDGVVLYRPAMRAEEEFPFAPGAFNLAGIRFTVTRCKRMEKDGRGYLDLKKIPETAVFRTRREGDAFAPFGGGRKKLKKYLIDKKIPLRERDRLILLADGKEVLAIVGMEISERVKVEEKSEIVRITISDKGE